MPSYNTDDMRMMFRWGLLKGMNDLESARREDGKIDASKFQEIMDDSFDACLRAIKNQKEKKKDGPDTEKEIGKWYASGGKTGAPPIPGLHKEPEQ